MLEELPVYVKLKNAYNPAHYPANKKISAEEWNALWMSVMYQGNHQEDILASILNITLPEYVASINEVETKAIQALLNSEEALGIVNEAHEMSSQALDIANEANQTANEALTDINLKQNITDEELITFNKTVVGAINEVKNSSVAVLDIVNNLNSIEINKPLSANMGNTLREMIQGQEFGRSYNTIEDLVDALNIEEPETFKVPFLFLIVDLDVPDFWVAEVMETSIPYEYTTDAALIAAVKTSPLQIGYYKISISETAKVDLTNYYNKTETNGLLDDKVDKVVGKELSENDYTNEDKLKVDIIDTDGDGTKYLSDDGSYKEISVQSRIQNSDNSSYFEAGGNVNNTVGDTEQETFFTQFKAGTGQGHRDITNAKTITGVYGKDETDGECFRIQVIGLNFPSTELLQQYTISENRTNEDEVAKIKDIKGKSVANYEIETTDWVADSTYSDLDFNYKATITIIGVLSTEKPEVAYSPADSVSGNFSNFPNSVVDGIEIWCKETPTSTIIIPLARTVIV